VYGPWSPGLAAGLALAGQDLAAPQTKQLLLQLAADAEGHPDNVAPAIYGEVQTGDDRRCFKLHLGPI